MLWIKACQTDLSVAQSALGEEKLVTKMVEEKKNELLEKINELETVLEEAQTSHSEEQERLQAKEEEVASQTEVVSTLQSQVDTLSQQLKHERHRAAVLQRTWCQELN